MPRLKWEKMVTEEGDLDHQKIAQAIWDKVSPAENFVMVKAWLMEVVEEIFEKGQENQKAKKKKR